VNSRHWLVLALGVAFVSLVRSHDAHRHEASTAYAGAAKVVMSAAPLLDQAGRRVRMAQDVIADRVAIVNFVYTACTTVCPVTSASFSQLQERLGGALGKEVVLVSISVDPLRDTPERLREYAKRFGARDGWVWLTGEKCDVDEVLKGFGAYTANFEDHPAMVLVGEASGGWTRYFGFPTIEQLLARADVLRLARASAAKPGHRHLEE